VTGPERPGAGIVWCASYPKSGNTWVRALLGAAMGGGDVDINRLEGAVHVAHPLLFDELGLSVSALGMADVEPLLRLVDQRVAARATTPVLRKLHDAHLPGPDGGPRALAGATRLVVYVVRDPRAVAVSWAHHLGTTQAVAVEVMRTPIGLGGATPSDWVAEAGTYRLGTWSDHVRSWLDQDGLPMVVVRYEELVREPHRELRRVLDAAGLTVDDRAVAAAVGASSFETLLIQELAGGFLEAPRAGVPFFRRGEADAWRDELPADLIREVEHDHAEVMQRLGYQPLAGSTSAAPHEVTGEDVR
jgi:hypothetical protein